MYDDEYNDMNWKLNKIKPCEHCGSVQAHFIDCPKTRIMGLKNQITTVCEHCDWREGHGLNCPIVQFDEQGKKKFTADFDYTVKTAKSYDVKTTGTYDDYFADFNDVTQHNTIVGTIQYLVGLGLSTELNHNRPSKQIAYIYKLLNGLIR